MAENPRVALLRRKEEIEAQLALLDRIPEDTFPFNTVALFAAQSGKKWFYRKVGEEAWISTGNNQHQGSLAQWILNAEDSNVGNFEVYILRVPELPFFGTV